VSDTGQQRGIDVDRLARLAPALKGDAADEAEPPPVDDAERLEIRGRADDFVHGRDM
jgi:hypothetical protein